MTHPTRVTVPGILALIMMGVFDLVYVLVTPCSLEFGTGSYYVPWAYKGCSFGMQTGGLIVTAIGMLIGFVLGWLVT
jgi:hypothetical protein